MVVFEFSDREVTITFEVDIEYDKFAPGALYRDDRNVAGGEVELFPVVGV